MKTIRSVLLSGLVCLVCAGGAGAAELTLDDCIELALQKRASIIQAQGFEKIASAEKRSALGAFLPNLSARYDYNKTKESDIESEGNIPTAFDTLIVTTIDGGQTAIDALFIPTDFEKQTLKLADQDRTSKSLSGLITLDIFDLGNFFSYSSAKAKHAAARLDVLASEQDLIYSVKVAYYAYLANVENVTVQEEAVKRSEEQLKLIQSKFDLGSASISDVLKQKVQYGNDRLTLLDARNAVTNSHSNLAYTIGVDPRESWTFATSYRVREYTGSLDDAVGFGLSHRPRLLGAQHSLNAAGRSLSSTRAEYLPKVAGFVQWNFSDATRGDTTIFNFSSRARTYGFQVTYNIFDGFFRESRISQAKVSRNNARAALADERNLALSQIKSAYLNIDKLKESKLVAGENVEASSEDLKITQEKYNLGAATILDLLDAQVSVKRAQVSQIKTDFDFNLAIAELEKAMGKM
jgi:outer membrane protein TolC